MTDRNGLHGLIDDLPDRWTSDGAREQWLDAFREVLDLSVVVDGTMSGSRDVIEPSPFEYTGRFTVGTECYARPGVFTETYEQVIIKANGVDHSTNGEPVCRVELANGSGAWVSEDHLVLTVPDVS